MTSKCRIPLVSIAACMATLTAPSLASANDYCVDTPCGGTQVDTIEQAFDLANDQPNADRIFLGPQLYTALPNGTKGFEYTAPLSPVEIVGAGVGRTVLTAPEGTDSVLKLTGGPGSSIHDLTLRAAKGMQAGGAGLRLSSSAARHIQVIEDGNQPNGHAGVQLWAGGALDDSSVELTSASSTAVEFTGGGGTVRASSLAAHTGTATHWGGAVIERSRITAVETGIWAAQGGTTIAESLVRLNGASGAGLRAEPTHAGVTLQARNVTVATPNDMDFVGALAKADSLYDVDVELTNSIIRGAGLSLVAFSNKDKHAHLSASYSDYDPSRNAELTAIPGNAVITETHASNVGDAGFADAANGDFRLVPGSRLIDAGDPTTAPGLDLSGNPLLADGNGDGLSRRDLGAYELQPAADQVDNRTVTDTIAPVITRFRARGARFRYSLSESARVTLTIKRARHGRYRAIATLTRRGQAGANRLRLSRRLARGITRPGRYRAVIRATDAAGNRSATRTVRLRVAGG